MGFEATTSKTFLLLAFALAALVGAPANDIVPVPAERREFFSPLGNYVFVLSTPDHWKSRKTIGELLQVKGQARNSLWTRPLSQEFGPRYVLVSDKGEVVLLDEWANIRSRYAVVILDVANQLVAQHDFDTIQKVLSVPTATVVRMARHGWWIMSPPVLESLRERVIVETAGKMLSIRLSDGHMSLSN